MAPPTFGDLATDAGLTKLDVHLATRSYIEGGCSPTEQDAACSEAVQRLPSMKFTNVLRWHNHITALRQRHPYSSFVGVTAGASSTAAAPTKAVAPPKGDKKQLVIDILPMKVENIRIPVKPDPDMGAGGKCLPGSRESPLGRYYISTSIFYCNGWPHIGHAYEALTSDVFARFHRLLGQDVFYMTGADEHGMKIAQTAEGEGMKPIEICDRYVDGFKALNQRLMVSSDFYVRTTEDRHKEVARSVWKKCGEAGDIHLDRYEGWYLVREERFITDQEAQEWNFKDPLSGVPLKKMSEPSFFFKMSKYQAKVIKHIEDNEQFIQPQQFRTEILERLKGMEMRDLSISRGSFDWGVPCPEDKVDGKQHVMYVWFDALINYISGVDGIDTSKPLSRFWPADMHIIGKDISWFHAVIWPSMLMSAGIPLPKSIVVHGFISGPDGRKMSKSFGNVVDPHDMLDKLPCDTLRWYLCRESVYGDDVKFSEESLRLMHNSELCDNLGNLVNRAVALSNGTVQKCEAGLVKPPFDLQALKDGVTRAFEAYRLSEAADLTIRACGATNKWIADLEPWKMKDADKQALKVATCRMLVESIYVLAHFFAPFIPQAAGAIFKKLSTDPRPIGQLRNDFVNLAEGTPVSSVSVLFAVVEAKVAEASPAAPVAAELKAAAKAPGKAEAGKAEAKADAKGKKGKKEPLPEDNPAQPLFSKLDIRVGKVVKAWAHPEAERLFVEEIDVGDPEGPRQIVSGLREHYTLEQFQGRKLLAVCNMVPAKLRGVTSYGMVLCAKNVETKVVELLSVPDDCPIGTRVLPDGVPASWKPYVPEAVKEYQVWENVAKELRTDSERAACFQGKALVAAKAKFLAPTLPNAQIS